VAPDPGVSFAAHEVAGGLMIDRMRDDDRGALVIGSRWNPFRLRRTLVVQRGPSQGEAIRIEGPGRAVVRTSDGPNAAVVGRVEPAGNGEAVRLTIAPASHMPVFTGEFTREPNGLGSPELRCKVDRDDELAGTYRARLRAPDGTVVGWLQVSVGGEQPSPVSYEGVLPPSIDEAMAAASAAALGEEIAWIHDHTLDAIPGFVDRP
jgi:hypothetical protein